MAQEPHAGSQLDTRVTGRVAGTDAARAALDLDRQYGVPVGIARTSLAVLKMPAKSLAEAAAG